MASFVCPISELGRFELNLVSSGDHGSVLLHSRSNSLPANEQSAEVTACSSTFIHVRYDNTSGKDKWRVFLGPALCEELSSRERQEDRDQQNFNVDSQDRIQKSTKTPTIPEQESGSYRGTLLDFQEQQASSSFSTNFSAGPENISSSNTAVNEPPLHDQQIPWIFAQPSISECSPASSDNQEANSYVNSFGTCNLNEITWTNGLASEILSEQPQDHPTLTPVMSGQTPMDFLSDNDNNFSQLTEFALSSLELDISDTSHCLNSNSFTSTSESICSTAPSSPQTSSTDGQSTYDHEWQRPYHCSTCDRSFKRAYTLKVHMNCHVTEGKSRKSFICSVDECGERFTRKHDRLRHEISQHRKKARFSCQCCPRNFSTSHTLQKHCQDKHPDTPAAP